MPYDYMYRSIAFSLVLHYDFIVAELRFEWDEEKDKQNQLKHGVPFDLAQYALGDPDRIIAEDISHSQTEKRYYCIGRVGDGILTVRFTYRKNRIRIIGAGYWGTIDLGG
jgi:uncharacterized DUF497 family protein